MRRPLYTWLLFGLCLAVGAMAMGWLGLTVARLDREQEAVRRNAALEENVRLALWRMDSALGPLIARESMRPYYTYSAFYPAERAYTRLFAELEPGEVLMASPLLTFSSPYIRLHFQRAPDGTLTSPQVPESNMRDLAEAAYVSHEAVNAAAERLDMLRRRVDVDMLLAGLPEDAPAGTGVIAPPRPAQAIQTKQAASNVLEWAAREKQVAVQQAQRPEKIRGKALKAAPQPPVVEPRPIVWREGPLTPLWIAGELVLVRRVWAGDEAYLQGCWLDWPVLQGWLLGVARDLLPQARLSPAPPQKASEAGDHGRMLAAMPIRLEPGAAPESAPRSTSPIRVALMVALGCIALATLAVASLMWGAVALSERRGAFVSAVTHELRTPLTTFQMYTEMLAEGMVPDEKKRQQYLDTLHAESNRLAHLVENVLSYARLERARTANRLDVVPVAALLEAVRGRLEQRARQAGMDLALERTDAPVSVRVDQAAIEQILFNLVDNACKYAASAEDRRIHLTFHSHKNTVRLRVRDHGPGIPAKERRRLFRPHASAWSSRDAAHSAPGVGLGLGLSRRLARAMRGRLRVDSSVADGACLELTLPIAHP